MKKVISSHEDIKLSLVGKMNCVHRKIQHCNRILVFLIFKQFHKIPVKMLLSFFPRAKYVDFIVCLEE